MNSNRKRSSVLKQRVALLRLQVLIVYFAARDPRMPIWVKMLAYSIAAYALSPIDLIPDFIPIIGFLDDLVIIPLGLAIVLRYTPESVTYTAKIKADATVYKPVSYAAAALILVIWLFVISSVATSLYFKFLA